MVSGESNYGETHLGNVDVLSSAGEVVAVAKLSAMKYQDDDGTSHWQGHLTAIAPPTAAGELDGEFTLRLPDGSSHKAVIESQQMNSQLSPGMDMAVTGVGEPPF
jgi:hypothetical protein